MIGHRMHRLALLSALLLVSSATYAQSIIVRGYIPGGTPTVICSGSACAAVLNSLISTGQYQLGVSEDPITDDYDEGFCSALSTEKPEPCGDTAPSTPTFDFLWQPNGCGSTSAGWGQDFAAWLVTNSYPAFTGNLNQPLTGYSFEAACNDHDTCWGQAHSRNDCDSAFNNAIFSACGSNSMCQGIAGGYMFAIGSQSGTDIYEAAVLAHECAGWHWDMEHNQCQNP